MAVGNDPATLCAATDNPEGLYVLSVATPLPSVTAEPAAFPSTLKFTVAPETAAAVDVRVRVAVSATGPADPYCTEFGLTLVITSVVATDAFTVWISADEGLTA